MNIFLMKPVKGWTIAYQNWEKVTYPAHILFFHTWTDTKTAIGLFVRLAAESASWLSEVL